MVLACAFGSERDAPLASSGGPAEVVNYVNEDEAEEPRVDDGELSPLWPTASDGRSGMRGKDGSRIVTPNHTAPYRLLSPIAATAYGRAYRARHIGQNREVALHYLPLKDARDSVVARQISLAVAKCAQLSHPNVIAIEEYGRDEGEGAHFVVTEPLEGVSLSSVLEDVHTLPLSRALGITLQMGRALRSAHKLGIVHGGLTPANVRLVESEDGERVRVVGFGALTIAPAELRNQETLLDPGRDYTAPECLRGAPPGTRSDVYALASLLFHMLTGAPPRVGAEVPRLSLASVEPVPRELEELMARCLDVVPEQRMGDVVSLVRKLREIARSSDSSAFAEGRRALFSETSMPPVELPPAEGDASGSLFGNEAVSFRNGALWIVAGLLLALAAVWLLWHASAHGPLELLPRPDVGQPR